MIADEVRNHFKKAGFRATKQEIRNAVYAVIELLNEGLTVIEILNKLYPKEDYNEHS